MRAFKAEAETNRKAWNRVAKRFGGVCALPDWGLFGECAGDDLLGPLEGKTVLEIGCGSGHSLAKVAQTKADRIYGLDFSSAALAMASELNQDEIASGRVTLIEAPMEQDLGLRNVDVAFSIQAIGWTLEPAQVFENVASYLKPGGRFVWSWGHPLFGKVQYQDGNLCVRDSYFNDAVWREEGWSDAEAAYMVTRPISAWFAHLTDAGFLVRGYLEPRPERISSAPQDPARYYSQAKLKVLPCTMIFICELPLGR
ncbi:MAG: class I SAM-dependent methyltransferase [Tepidisphaeraceae bacterium]